MVEVFALFASCSGQYGTESHHRRLTIRRELSLSDASVIHFFRRSSTPECDPRPFYSPAFKHPRTPLQEPWTFAMKFTFFLYFFVAIMPFPIRWIIKSDTRVSVRMLILISFSILRTSLIYGPCYQDWRCLWNFLAEMQTNNNCHGSICIAQGCRNCGIFNISLYYYINMENR